MAWQPSLWLSVSLSLTLSQLCLLSFIHSANSICSCLPSPACFGLLWDPPLLSCCSLKWRPGSTELLLLCVHAFLCLVLLFSNYVEMVYTNPKSISVSLYKAYKDLGFGNRCYLVTLIAVFNYVYTYFLVQALSSGRVTHVKLSVVSQWGWILCVLCSTLLWKPSKCYYFC